MTPETWTFVDRRHYRTGQKWHPGPWDDEPDRIEWRRSGIPCLIIRSLNSGYLCGYAAVPPGHPWHGAEFHDSDLLDATHDAAHGGLTYSARCEPNVDHDNPGRAICHRPDPDEPDDVWWLGFDCGHTWDLSPAATADDLMYGPGPDEVYRSVHYVTGRVDALADAIAEGVAS